MKKPSTHQINFNMKIIDKLITERWDPDFDRNEYPVAASKKDAR